MRPVGPNTVRVASRSVYNTGRPVFETFCPASRIDLSRYAKYPVYFQHSEYFSIAYTQSDQTILQFTRKTMVLISLSDGESHFFNIF